MPVYAISDLHGELPEWPSDATIAFIAGDICPDFLNYRPTPTARTSDNGQFRQANWLDTHFREWLSYRPEGCLVYGTWGNHDWVGMHRKLIPELPMRFLVDQGATILRGDLPSLKVWGTPWCVRLSGWAFYGSQEARTAAYDLIPVDLDLLMSHGPPRGYGDLIPARTRFNPSPEDINVGDDELLAAIVLKRPKTVICGHIHEARDHWVLPDPLGSLYNVAAVDKNYALYPRPWRRLYELEQ